MAVRFEQPHDGSTRWTTEANCLSRAQSQRTERWTVSPEIPVQCLSESSDAESMGVSSPDGNHKEVMAVGDESLFSSARSCPRFPFGYKTTILKPTDPFANCRDANGVFNGGGPGTIESTNSSPVTTPVPLGDQAGCVTSDVPCTLAPGHPPMSSSSSLSAADSRLCQRKSFVWENANPRSVEIKHGRGETKRPATASEQMNSVKRIKQYGGMITGKTNFGTKEVHEKGAYFSDGITAQVDSTILVDDKRNSEIAASRTCQRVSRQNGGDGTPRSAPNRGDATNTCCEDGRNFSACKPATTGTNGQSSAPHPGAGSSSMHNDDFSESDAAEALLFLCNAIPKSQETTATTERPSHFLTPQSDNSLAASSPISSTKIVPQSNAIEQRQLKSNCRNLTQSQPNAYCTQAETYLASEMCIERHVHDMNRLEESEASTASSLHFKKAFCRKFEQSLDKRMADGLINGCSSTKMAAADEDAKTEQNGVGFDLRRAMLADDQINRRAREVDCGNKQASSAKRTVEAYCNQANRKDDQTVLRDNAGQQPATPIEADLTQDENDSSNRGTRQIGSSIQLCQASLRPGSSAVPSSMANAYRCASELSEAADLPDAVDEDSQDDVTDTDCSGDYTSDSDDSCSSSCETTDYVESTSTTAPKGRPFVLSKAKFTLPAKATCGQTKPRAFSNLVARSASVSAPFSQTSSLHKASGKTVQDTDARRVNPKRVAAIREATFTFKSKSSIDEEVVRRAGCSTAQKSPTFSRTSQSVALARTSLNLDSEERDYADFASNNAPCGGIEDRKAVSADECNFAAFHGGASFEILRIENENKATCGEADEQRLPQSVNQKGRAVSPLCERRLPRPSARLPNDDGSCTDKEKIASPRKRRPGTRSVNTDLALEANNNKLAASTRSSSVAYKLAGKRKATARLAAATNSHHDMSPNLSATKYEASTCGRCTVASSSESLSDKWSTDSLSSNSRASSVAREEVVAKDTPKITRTRARNKMRRRKSANKGAVTDISARTKRQRASGSDLTDQSETVCSAVVNRCVTAVLPVNGGFHLMSSFPGPASLKAGVARGELLPVSTMSNSQHVVARWSKGSNVRDLKQRRQRDSWKRMTLDMFCMGR